MGKPTALVLTRQNLPTYDESDGRALKGGYILKKEKGEKPDVVLLASGSEVEQAVAARDILAGKGIDARVVSMPCMELFNAQSAEYRDSVIPADVRARVAMEAGATMPWYRYVGLDGSVIGLDHYGDSAPAATLFKEFGITAEHMAEEAEKVFRG